MNKECIDNSIGLQLHAYELDMLSEEKTEQFEIHLMKCDFCLSQLNKFAEVSQLLHSDEVKEQIQKLEGMNSKEPSFKTKILSPVNYGKSILVASILLICIYFGSTFVNNIYEENAQQIRLFPQRSSSNNVQYLSTDQPLEIVFGFEGSIVNSCYHIEIFNENDSIVYIDNSFCEFNRLSLGKIKFTSRLLESGRFKMIITDKTSDLLNNSQEYRFTILYK